MPFRIQTWLLVISFWLKGTHASVAQQTTDSLSHRKWILTSGLTVGTATSLVALNELWYKGYPRSPLHSFNDNKEWMQMDKAGHIVTCYTLGELGAAAFRWSGHPEKRSVLLGGSIGLIYMTGIEILDGHSAQWGFSWGDQAANFFGTSTWITQQLLWKEQRITFKFSYSPSDYAQYNPEQLGRNFQQRILKDYNAQTYWASINVSRFLAPDAGFPKWLNIAIGYGADGMTDAKNDVDSVNNFQRTREYYVSFDADLNRVPWPRKWMKTTARILSFIKLPAPALEVQSDGQVKWHALFF